MHQGITTSNILNFTTTCDFNLGSAGTLSLANMLRCCNPAAGANSGATAWRAENNADVSTYGAIGRLVYISAAVSF